MKEVVIVGAGPAGLAVAACLNVLSIPFIILEKEQCVASLWKHHTYDRLKLHLAKQFCALPHMPPPNTAPTFIPKADFIRYLDEYAEHFKLSVEFSTVVESAMYNESSSDWSITSRNKCTGEVVEYIARFLVVATGENSEGIIPDIPGIKSFKGEVTHSSEYRSGKGYAGKSVLVVGSGNSGMEIAYDLSSFRAKTSIAIRSPFHVMTKEIIYLGMVLVKYLPVNIVDTLLLMLSKLKYGDLTKYGITKPKQGPLLLKNTTGRSAIIDVGTVEKIKNGEIQVLKGPASMRGKEVIFTDGKSYEFDAVIFATGYKSTANNWLKDEAADLSKDGFPTKSFPDHWRGKNGVYFAGLARRGLPGIHMDALNIANDIMKAYNGNLIEA